ncbi:putative iron-sulfur-binding oxidoreductase FadF [anaerobic digester metagenome]
MLEKYKYGVMDCGRCGKCIVGKGGYVCPVHQHMGGFEEYVARGRNGIARAILEGELELTQDLVDNAYTCLGCDSCYVACGKVNHKTHQLSIHVTEINQALRADIVNAGLEPESLKAVDAAIQSSHNPFGEDSAKRVSWAKELNLPTSGETVYFAGCYASYRNTNIAKATVASLKAGGIDVAYMGEDEWCCGVPQIADGNTALAEEMIMHNVEALKVAGVKRVITSCAGCYHALKTEYPKVIGKLPFEVVHSSEVFAQLIEEGKIKPEHEVASVVTYHDPCHLGRHEKVYDQPRAVLNAIPGTILIEMPRNKDFSWCCGGGSIISTVNPELTADIAADRVAEAKATKADTIVSTCPSCERILTTDARKDKIKVVDLSEMLAKSLGIKY